MRERTKRRYMVVVGVSAGGFAALPRLLGPLKASFSLPVIIVQHEAPNAGDFLPQYLCRHCRLPVKQADEKESIKGGMVYLAPPGYHLLIEEDRTFALSVDDPVNHARPSIDVLFETAAEVYGEGTIGVILTGANSDGAEGLKRIKAAGGHTVVQEPSTAESAYMPRAALAATVVDTVLPLDQIGPYLNGLAED
jgi:two-component system, chemotaxis family, protein-glutamate methylesterase/glutaminase